MNRISQKLLCMLATLVLSLAGSALAYAEDDSELEQIRVKIDERFDEIGPENVTRSAVNEWFTVQKGSIVAYISADGRYLLQGDMIDLDRQLNLSEIVRTDARRLLMSTVGDDRVITFSPANVKHSVTVFTDVDCTYCRKLHSEIDDYLANGIEIRYVLYPRNGPASPSWNTSEDVWCANDRNKALTAAKLSRGFETHKCDATTISSNYTLGLNVGLTGTPAMVFEDGTLLSGYLPPDALWLRLENLASATN